MYLWYNFKWKVSKKYVSVLSSTSCQIFQNSRTKWLVLWRHCLIYRRLKFDFAKATNKLCHICNNATGKGSFQLKSFLVDGKRRNVWVFNPARWDERRSRVRQLRVGQHDLLPRFEGRLPRVRTAGAAESIAEVTLPHGMDKLVFVARLVEGKTERKKSTHTSTGRFRRVLLLLFPTTLLVQLLSKTAGATQTHHRLQFSTFALQLLLKIED